MVMSNEKNISVEEYCTHYSIEASFVRSLSENGLIDIIGRGAAKKYKLSTSQKM